MLSDFIDKIYLASQSMGRRLILESENIDVIVCPTNADEDGSWDNPEQMVEDLAKRKLDAFIRSGKYRDRSIVAVASDTVVVLDGNVIGKASSAQEASKQLTLLSGRAHYVYSSYAL